LARGRAAGWRTARRVGREARGCAAGWRAGARGRGRAAGWRGARGCVGARLRGREVVHGRFLAQNAANVRIIHENACKRGVF